MANICPVSMEISEQQENGGIEVAWLVKYLEIRSSYRTET
jgi:hypothetical protein